MHPHEELLGADFFEHDIRHAGVGVSRAVSVLQFYHDDVDPTIESKGANIGNVGDSFRSLCPFVSRSKNRSILFPFPFGRIVRHMYCVRVSKLGTVHSSLIQIPGHDHFLADNYVDNIFSIGATKARTSIEKQSIGCSNGSDVIQKENPKKKRQKQQPSSTAIDIGYEYLAKIVTKITDD